MVHRFVDERRKDYFVLYLHHIVTIMLVSGSFAAGYTRVGVCVLFVHDISDILVDALKMLNYLKLEGRQGLFASEISYVFCVASWFYWRLYEFPFRVIKSSAVDALDILPALRGVTSPYNSVWDFLQIDEGLLFYMNALLVLLFCLHVYWAHLFLLIGYRILTESVREASRQEYEGDSD
jgi:ceramide synthetase